jgi:hypothetical protein
MDWTSPVFFRIFASAAAGCGTTPQETTMFPQNDLGAALFKTWNEEQRREEIGKLVEGYRNGVPLGILCKMAETIAGSQSAARGHLVEFLTLEERQTAVANASGGMKILVQEFLL